MAAQEELDIPFSSSHTQQTFKLLELPNELLALLESDNPPTLRLETCPTTNLALLITPNSRYRIQQKNSSNPLLILHPSTTRASLPGIAEDEDSPAITTIAKIEDTLELLPAGEADAVPEKKVNKWHEKFAKTRKK